MSLSDAHSLYLPIVEAELDRLTLASALGLAEYYGMMRYHLGLADESLQPARASSGKRLRPILCLLSCEAAGGDPALALPAAAAVELVHNFSLVHDDIQDGSHYRRGRRAVWDIWGLAHGINVGDGLFVLARQTMLNAVDQGLPIERCWTATMAFDQACLALCEGQYLDMSFEERLDVDLDEYLGMIRRKTASLLAASAQLGAIIANAPAKATEGYYEFALNLGLAFQIQDDILGIWGDKAITGKSAATDIRHKKKTLPVVFALSHPPSPADARELAALYSSGGRLDDDGISSVLAILDAAGARRYAEDSAQEYYGRSVASLAQLGADTSAHLALQELAASLLGREL